jgi:geranylgeranyl pyrophosphate synthase
MDLYRLTLAYLGQLSPLEQWSALQALLNRISVKKPRFWQLPITACAAVNGDGMRALPGMAAIACLHTSILLIDDMLDADPKGEYHHLGQPATANLAAALQAAGLAAIAESEPGVATRFLILRRLNQMVVTTALGQHWDVQNPADEESYWQVVRTKSAPFFGAALYTGALFAGASEETAWQLDQIGALYGEMVQIHDDLNDVMETPANPDWTLGRSPLPVLFAQLVPHPERAWFCQLRQRIHEPGALAEAQTILIRCGAVSYAVDQLLRRYVQARKLLADLTLAHPQPVHTLLDEVVNPVKELLAGVGFRQTEVLLAALLPPFEPAV